MKYTEYQVWFHAFNNAVLGLSHRTDINVFEIQDRSDKIAKFCVEKFKEVEVPEVPDLPNLGGSPGAGIDLKSIVEQVAKEAIKANGKRKP
jgi:hypothetical protein